MIAGWFIDPRIAAHIPHMRITYAPAGVYDLWASDTGWWHVMLGPKLVTSSHHFGNEKGIDLRDAQQRAQAAAKIPHELREH